MNPNNLKSTGEPLVLISGKVRTLETKEGYKNFLGVGKSATQAAAIGAAASSALFNSAILGSAAMMKENVTSYQSTIGILRLMVFFDYIGLKSEFEVEAVLELESSALINK